MIEVSTSILTVEKGKEAETFFALEKSKTDYFHIDVMDGKFVEKDTYQNMLEYSSYIRRISNLPMDIHLMVEDVETGIEVFSAVEPNIITFHIEACKNKEEIINELKEICRVKLAEYEQPVEFIIKDELPLTSIGKIDSFKLKQEQYDKAALVRKRK